MFGPARAGAAARVRRATDAPIRAAVAGPGGATSSAGSNASSCTSATARERIADRSGTRCSARMEQAPASTATRGLADQGSPTSCGELQERFAQVGIEDHSRTFNTELDRRAGAVASCSTWPRRSSHSRAAAQGVPRRAPAHRLPRPRRRAVPGALAGLPQRRRAAAGRVSAGDDHPLAAGRTGLREVSAQWRTAITIILQVTRYRPEQRGRADASQATRSRCTRTGRPRRPELHQGPARRHAVATAGRAGWASAAAAA